MISLNDLKESVIKILDEKKAEDIVEIDLSSCNARLADCSIIASGTSSRHAQAVADYIYRFLKSQRIKPHLEGTAQTGWIMIEANGIEVHLFKPDLRAYYNLEEILSSGKTPSDLEA